MSEPAKQPQADAAANRPPIEFFSTDELVAELSSRCSAMVIGFQLLSNAAQYFVKCRGCRLAQIGLAAEVRRSARRGR